MPTAKASPHTRGRLRPYWALNHVTPWIFLVNPAFAYMASCADLGRAFVSWFAFASLGLVANHRFFSHVSFETSRPFRLVLGFVSCLGMQYGPLWWSSKHRRHHKHCDLPEDSHSWKQTSFWYAWMLWTQAQREQQIDVEFLHPSLFDAKPSFHLPPALTPLHSRDTVHGRHVAPELLLLDKLWWAPFVLLHLTLHLVAGLDLRTIFLAFTTPLLNIVLPILLFNVIFHPHDDLPPLLKHPKGATAVGCYALDSLVDPLTFMLGESHHADHHKFPARARRPGPIDLSWVLIVKPLLATGLIWNPRMMQNKAIRFWKSKAY